jgi:hypothetical protein
MEVKICEQNLDTIKMMLTINDARDQSGFFHPGDNPGQTPVKLISYISNPKGGRK